MITSSPTRLVLGACSGFLAAFALGAAVFDSLGVGLLFGLALGAVCGAAIAYLAGRKKYGDSR
ncbi:MAG: hypothetical protein ACT6RL_19250 [Neoaquamicrobium sediminum]|uniref:hypothetical protein n=1 Tax=Neoaquamicrobium sediminum TaxID=1849104 RepID=UPI00403725AD